MITVGMVGQVHSTYYLINKIVNNIASKESSIFIKDITHKMDDENKK